MIKTLYNSYHKIYFKIYRKFSHLSSKIKFFVTNVKHSSFVCVGTPVLNIHPNGTCVFGAGLSMINNAEFATLGKNNRCKIVVSSGAKLILGNNVGMSNASIISTLSIIIGNNILIGGGVLIVDTDFHSLNYKYWHTKDDEKYMNKVPVVIKDNVFIGMNSIILKGVTIGSNVIIAAGSIVTKNIPENQIWGGNPAKFIKNNII